MQKRLQDISKMKVHMNWNIQWQRAVWPLGYSTVRIQHIRGKTLFHPVVELVKLMANGCPMEHPSGHRYKLGLPCGYIYTLLDRNF